jgi:hypothetical protein
VLESALGAEVREWTRSMIHQVATQILGEGALWLNKIKLLSVGYCVLSSLKSPAGSRCLFNFT